MYVVKDVESGKTNEKGDYQPNVRIRKENSQSGVFGGIGIIINFFCLDHNIFSLSHGKLFSDLLFAHLS